MRIVQELRRRRIFRTAALYIVAAWGVLQVADLAFPAMLDQQHTPRNLMHLSFTYSALGDIDMAIEYLELAFEARSDWLPWVAFENAYGGAVEPMRDDPRFQAVVDRFQLPIYE